MTDEVTTGWTPSRLIEVFCRPGLRSGFREAGPSDHGSAETAHYWHAGFCSYQGRDSYGPGIDGFDDGHTAWGELCHPFSSTPWWSLVQDPGDRQFPYSFKMVWNAKCVTDGTIVPRRHWQCEQHQGVIWPHDLCHGPGMPFDGVDAKWCAASYAEGDFGIEVYDTPEGLLAGVEAYREWDRRAA